MELNEETVAIFDKRALNPNCTKLEFSSKQITRLKPSALQKFVSLKEIHLCDNRITEIPENFFDFNVKLSFIWICKNPLTKLSRNLLRSLQHLRIFIIHDTHLDEIDRDLFVHNEKLEIIHLNSNKIKHIHRDAFKMQYKLKELWVQGNQLEYFDFASLGVAQNLVEINFADNLLSEVFDYQQFITWFRSLETVYISYNNFNNKYLKSICESLDMQGIEVRDLDSCVALRKRV